MLYNIKQNNKQPNYSTDGVEQEIGKKGKILNRNRSR